MTINEIVKDKIRGDIEREQALEVAHTVMGSAIFYGNATPEDFVSMSDGELIEWTENYAVGNFEASSLR